MPSLLSEIDEERERSLHSFSRLIRPTGGIVQAISQIDVGYGFPRFLIGNASLGNISMTLPNVNDGPGTTISDQHLGGAGSDSEREGAWVKALAEALERYCTLALTDEDTLLASADELGENALNLDSVPRLSDNEYADPQCLYVRPDKSRRIRWVRGISLPSGKSTYVPVAMSHLYTGAQPAERSFLEISTGVAAHTDFGRALVSALCEAIERDALTLAWLARLPLARLVFDEVDDPKLRRSLSLLNSSQLRQLFFDATTDVGVPTVFSIQLMDGHPSFSQASACATAPTMAEACAKVIAEATQASNHLKTRSDCPDDPRDFTRLHHGAVFSGKPENRKNFSFLLDSPYLTYLSKASKSIPDASNEQAKWIVNRLSALGMDVILVDLTTEEVRAAGLWVLRVIVPQLMPMSPIYRARFLGHRRLYAYASNRGIADFSEDQVNPDPQPIS